MGLTWQQLLLRPALNFQVHRKVMPTGGYGFIEIYRYGVFPASTGGIAFGWSTGIPLPWGGGRRYYAGIYDEIMFNFGKNVANNVFDQNRFYIALGRQKTLQVAIYSKLPFGH